MWLTLIADKLFGGVTDYFSNKQKHQQALEEKKQDLEVAKVSAEIGMVQQQKSADISLDLITIKDRGILNEVITYTLLAPFIITLFNPLAALIFGYDPLIISVALTQGFESLKTLPQEFYYGLLIVFSDVFGLRSFLRGLFEGVLSKYMKKSM